MSADLGKIRLKLKDGAILVKVILNHPMESGSRKDPVTGELIPRHFIREVVCEHDGRPVLTLDWGWGISANPFLSFVIKEGAKGDTVTVRWTDNQQMTGVLEAVVT
jgi:sulfur-oxidizing protein SoxZ